MANSMSWIVHNAILGRNWCRYHMIRYSPIVPAWYIIHANVKRAQTAPVVHGQRIQQVMKDDW